LITWGDPIPLILIYIGEPAKMDRIVSLRTAFFADGAF
jgi:hypothetical protein